MRWGLVAELAVPGFAIGLAVVFGMQETAMWIGWGLLRILSALWIARSLRRRHFVHGFWAGGIGGTSAVLAGAVLYGTYTANHPEYLEEATRMSGSIDPRLLLVFIAVGVGLVHGIVQGVLAWTAARIVTSR